MSRLKDPGCMLRALSAGFGALFLPIGVSFFFVLHHRHWLEGLGAVAAAFGFFYLAWRAYDILGLDDVGPATDWKGGERRAPPGPSPDSPPEPSEPKP